MEKDNQPSSKNSKKIESTLSGEQLKKFKKKCADEGMKEAEAIRYALNKWTKDVNLQQ